jgi:hypothetical protein
MSIRFAAARQADSRVRHVLGGAAIHPAANDNGGGGITGGADDPMLRAALRHFAAHGLAAAEAARRNAEKAFFADDRAAYRWWLGICRMLDRRMAETLAARPGAVGLG